MTLKIPQQTPYHIQHTVGSHIPKGRKILQVIGKHGNDSAIVAISTSVVGVVLRPLLILLDKDAKKEDRQYAASWNFVLSTGIIALELLFFKNIKKNAERITQKLFTKRGFKVSKQHMEGFSNWIKFIAIRSIVTGAVILDTIYLGRLLDKISLKYTGKPFIQRTQNNKDEKSQKREKTLDTIIKYTIVITGAGALLNYVGKKKTGKPIVLNALKATINETDHFLTNSSSVYRAIKGTTNTLTGKFVQKVYHNKSFFEKEAILKDGWIPRNMLVNAVVRPIMALTVGQPYLALRTFIEEILGASIVKRIGDPLVKYSTNKLNLVIKPKNKDEVEGVKVLAGQLMRNIFLLNIAIGLFNNKIDNKLITLIKKIIASEPKEKNLGSNTPINPMIEWINTLSTTKTS